MSKQRILLGMSGGIDSTLAIKLLQDANYEVVGLTLNIDAKNKLVNIEKAQRLAAFFAIEHHVVDVSADFERQIVDYFTREYLRGKTPSPCSKCNSVIKMHYLLDYSKKYDCCKIATGHYVNVVCENGIYYITRGADKQKDQSYFLWNISQNILSKCVFPLGSLLKKDIISKANQLGLKDLAKSGESMSVCFLQGNDYRHFLDKKFPHLRQALKNGKIIDADGAIIGKHDGYPYYTIGQKRSLMLNDGITGQYVAKIDAENNILQCLPKREIISKKIESTDFYFNNSDFLTIPQNVLIRIRGFDYQEPTSGQICKKNDTLTILFDKAVWAVTPGQPIIFYVGDKVVGGAIV